MSRYSTDEEWNALAQALMFKDECHMYQVLYEEEGLPVSEIASRLNCGTATLNRRMSAYRIKKRPRGGAHSKSDKRSILFYVDQRLIVALPSKLLSEMYGMSYSLVYQYKRWKAGGSYAGYNLTNSGRKTSMEGLRS